MLHCNGIDPFIMLMGNFICNWGPISCKDMVSRVPVAWWSLGGLSTGY